METSILYGVRKSLPPIRSNDSTAAFCARACCRCVQRKAGSWDCFFCIPGAPEIQNTKYATTTQEVRNIGHFCIFFFFFFVHKVRNKRARSTQYGVVRSTNTEFFVDVNHTNGCRTAWLGVHPPVQPVIVPKVHCSREGFVFQLYLFLAGPPNLSNRIGFCNLRLLSSGLSGCEGPHKAYLALLIFFSVFSTVFFTRHRAHSIIA